MKSFIKSFLKVKRDNVVFIVSSKAASSVIITGQVVRDYRFLRQSRFAKNEDSRVRADGFEATY